MVLPKAEEEWATRASAFLKVPPIVPVMIVTELALSRSRVPFEESLNIAFSPSLTAAGSISPLLP